MFTNKHVVVALIVAPILSVLAWFAVGNLTGEQPAPAQHGQAYPLVAKSNCRWPSGSCDLENEEFQLRLSFSSAGDLEVSSAHPLQGVLVSIYDPSATRDPPPVSLKPSDGEGFAWEVLELGLPASHERIRLVASAEGSQYYGEPDSTFARVSTDTIPNPDR